MKRVLVLAAFLGFFGLNLYAQDPARPADDKPAEEKTDDTADEGKEEEKPAEPAKPDRAKGGKVDRKAFGELGRVLRTKDTDRDTKLSKDEFGDDGLFDTLDKDKDGLLTLQEMAADKDAVIASIEKQAGEAVKEEFGILDRDSSGKLTKTELGEEFGGLLEKGDADKDGELNLEEFTAARKIASTDKKEDKPGKGDAISNLDKDADGKISKEEAGERLKEQFDKLDADGDGFLTAEELKAVRGKMRKDGKKGKEAEKEAEEKKDTPEEEKKETPEGEGDGEDTMD